MRKRKRLRGARGKRTTLSFPILKTRGPATRAEREPEIRDFGPYVFSFCEPRIGRRCCELAGNTRRSRALPDTSPADRLLPIHTRHPSRRVSRTMRQWSVRVSSLFSLQFRKSLPEFHQRLLGVTHDTKPAGSRAEVLLGAAAACRCRFSQIRGDESFFLEPRQRVVDAAEQHVAARRLLDFIRNGNAVRVVPRPNNREHHHQFEVAERGSRRHLF